MSSRYIVQISVKHDSKGAVLVQELTAKATWEVALGAGARGLHYAYKLSPSDRGRWSYERENFDHVLANNYVERSWCHEL